MSFFWRVIFLGGCIGSSLVYFLRSVAFWLKARIRIWEPFTICLYLTTHNKNYLGNFCDSNLKNLWEGSILNHIALRNYVKALTIKFYVLEEMRNLNPLLLDKVLLTQSQTVLHCYLAAMQMNHVQFMPIFQNLKCSHQIYLIFVHSCIYFFITKWLWCVGNSSLSPDTFLPTLFWIRLVFCNSLINLREWALWSKIAAIIQ